MSGKVPRRTGDAVARGTEDRVAAVDRARIRQCGLEAPLGDRRQFRVSGHRGREHWSARLTVSFCWPADMTRGPVGRDSRRPGRPGGGHARPAVYRVVGVPCANGMGVGTREAVRLARPAGLRPGARHLLHLEVAEDAVVLHRGRRIPRKVRRRGTRRPRPRRCWRGGPARHRSDRRRTGPPQTWDRGGRGSPRRTGHR